jgi:hypothetical protein
MQPQYVPPATQPQASWLGILANGFAVLWGISGAILWSVFSFFTTALGSRWTNGFNPDLVQFFTVLGAPPLLIAFVLAIVGFVAGVKGNAKRSLLCALGSSIATLMPALSLVLYFLWASG